jgi:hypothetical protein
VGIFQNNCFGKDANSLYSGNATAKGNNAKNETPMPNVIARMNSHAGTMAVAKIVTMRMESVAMVRVGTRHS